MGVLEWEGNTGKYFKISYPIKKTCDLEIIKI